MNAIFTIISKNYLSYARTLTNSYLEHNPYGKVFVILVDKNNGHIKLEDERFILIEADQIGIPNFEQFSFKYSIMELNTAVKPFFIEYLYKNYPIDKLIYFDPDILVLDSVEPIFNLLNERINVVLTPHLTRPIPDDGKMPNEVMIMRAGTYNLGFIALGKYESIVDFIDWWKDRLYKYCINDVNNGYFVDQKFIDLIVGFRNDIYILRQPQYNMAYWNLHERVISRERNIFMSNGVPICFYHFSGIEPKGNTISKHQNRLRLEDNKVLTELFDIYKQKLHENGYDQTISMEYHYGKFTSGIPIKDSDRRTYYHLNEAQKKIIHNPYTSSL